LFVPEEVRSTGVTTGAQAALEAEEEEEEEEEASGGEVPFARTTESARDERAWRRARLRGRGDETRGETAGRGGGRSVRR